jgi:dihydrofolate reductase
MNPVVPGTPRREANEGAFPRAYELCGYAIVSDEGMIADADGTMPAQLRNDADWAYFQAELDRAQLVLLGRLSHLAAPNPRRRPRLVVSASVASLERRPEAWWWNPAALALPAVLERLLPQGGRVAVPGGTGVFDLVLRHGAFAEFHLAHAVGVKIPGGRPAFSALGAGESAGSLLGRCGLQPGPPITLDPAAPVEMVVWRRGP